MSEEQLTVDKIEKLIEWLELPRDKQHPEQQPEGVFSSPVEIYKFLLSQLATIERDTAEKCVELIRDSSAGVGFTHQTVILPTIRDHFNLDNSEE